MLITVLGTILLTVCGVASAHVKVAVMRSWGSVPVFAELNDNWQAYGTVPLTIDTSLMNASSFTYQDLVNTGADVLWISDPAGAWMPKQYSAGEIDAVRQYVSEGHSILGTYKVFQNGHIDNRGLAPVFGLRQDIAYNTTFVSASQIFDILVSHPLFDNLPHPYVSSGWPNAQVPADDFTWDLDDFGTAQLLAQTNDKRGVVTWYQTPSYHAIFVSEMLEYHGNPSDTQFLYNALTVREPAMIYYVDADANGANDGSSWADAYNYLQDALAAAQYGDEIWVAEGIYTPDQGIGITPGDRTATFQLINGVAIRGGYAGFGEPDPNDRDIELYETILSGDLNGNDIEVANPRDLENEPTRAENSYHVVTGSGTDTMAILEGFNITAGNANGDFYSEHANGGGMYNSHGNLTLVNCTFSGNSANSDGGGVYNRYYSSPTLNNCAFSGNFAGAGGGMYNYESNPTLTNCVFSGNSAGNRGGGVYNRNYSSPTLTNCTFSGNSAGQHGGGIWCQYGGGGPPLRSGPPLGCALIIINSILWGDTPEEIYVSDGTTVVTYCDVEGGWPGEGNIDADPCFAEPGCWDPNGTPEDANDDFWVDGDYHLISQAGRWDANDGRWTKDEATSPCIDAGDTKSPIGYELFPNGGIINMGAYGGTVKASKSYFGEPVCETVVAGDINGDCKVNFLDFRLMAFHWLEDNSFYREVPEFYYYSSNRKIYLDLYTQMIAVYFQESLSQDEREALIRQDPILEAIVAEMARYGVVLVGTKAGSSEIDIMQTIERLEKLPEVRYSTPVFGDSATQLILTDEFIAKFKPDVTEAEIDAFNTLNAVEIEDKIEGIEHYILRVKDPTNMNTLRTTNLYYENPITIFSVPNFIGIGGELP